MKFFHYWLAKLRYLYLEYRYSVAGVKTPDWHYTRDLLALVRAKNFVHYRPEHGMAHELTLFAIDNIGSMTELHRDLANKIETEETIPAEWISKRNTELITLDAWLTVKDGCYVRPENALDEFLFETIRMLDLVAKYEDSDAGVQQYNRRVMRTVFLNAQTLASSLVRCHYECMQ